MLHFKVECGRSRQVRLCVSGGFTSENPSPPLPVTVPVTKLVVRVEEVVALVTGKAVLEHDLHRHVEMGLRPLLPPLSLLPSETRNVKTVKPNSKVM